MSMLFDCDTMQLAVDLTQPSHRRVRELLRRCLRLEARIGELERQRELAWEREEKQKLGKPRRTVTPHDIAQMCALRREGLTIVEIVRRTTWAYPTVRNYTRDVDSETL